MAADVSASLPDLNLQDQSIVTVDSGNALVPITSLVVHGTQADPDSPLPQLETVSLLNASPF